MPLPGAGGGRPSSLDGCPLRQSARGNRPGARTGEGAGKGLETAQVSKIHFKPPSGAGGGSVAGEGVGIGILAERNDIKAPAGSGRGQRSGGGGGDWVVVCACELNNICGRHAPPIKGAAGRTQSSVEP